MMVQKYVYNNFNTYYFNCLVNILLQWIHNVGYVFIPNVQVYCYCLMHGQSNAVEGYYQDSLSHCDTQSFIKRNYRFLPGVKATITTSTYPNSPEIYRTLAKFGFSIYSYVKVYNIPACHKWNPTHSAIPDPLHWRTLLQQLDSSCYLWKHKSKFGCELWNLMGWFPLNSNRNVLG